LCERLLILLSSWRSAVQTAASGFVAGLLGLLVVL
jgi:hypothetical protein